MDIHDSEPLDLSLADEIRAVMHDAIFNVPELENSDFAAFLEKRLLAKGWHK